jgi:hypothetical protein
MEQIRQLSNPTGMPFAILAFVLKRRESFTALDFFRKSPGGEWSPTNDHVTRIDRILKGRLETALRMECTQGQIVNLPWMTGMISADDDIKVSQLASSTRAP